jgi:hypothetical protein
MLLNQFAWTILDDERITARDLPLALQAAQTANDVTKGEDPSVLDTYALALFKNGKVAEAIEAQQKAIKLIDDKDAREELEGRLKEFQDAAGKKGESKPATQEAPKNGEKDKKPEKP